MFNLSSNVTAVMLIRNEAKKLPDRLPDVAPFVREIIVLDNGSTDDSAKIARDFGCTVIHVPYTGASNFDALRQIGIDAAKTDYVFIKDGDERMPPALIEELQRTIREHDGEFAALMVPFKNYFCKKWMQHSGWWPGFSRPQLLRRGLCRYNDRLHSGVSVDGPIWTYPPNPDHAIEHLSYDDLRHYIAKVNNYTTGEAENLLADGGADTWQAMIAHFVADWKVYYDTNRAHLDGMHGFVLAFMSAFYRFVQRAKAWDLRRQKGDRLTEYSIPQSVSEIFAFMADVVQNGPDQWLGNLYEPCARPRKLVPDLWIPEPRVTPSAHGAASGITAAVVGGDEGAAIERCLEALEGRIAGKVVDAGSGKPVEAEQDALAASGDWELRIEARDRVPAELVRVLEFLVREHADEFDAIAIPVKQMMYGRWLQSPAWWPGEFDAQFVRRNVPVTAERTLHLPPTQPELAIVRGGCSSIHQFMTRMNDETDAAAEKLAAAGASHSWQAQLTAFTETLSRTYDRRNGRQDGIPGFIQSFLEAMSAYISVAKLWDLRQQKGETSPTEAVPGSLGEMLAFMSALVGGAAAGQGAQSTHLPLVWEGPLFDASGYADSGRNLVLAAAGAGIPIAISPQAWSETEVPLAASDNAALRKLLAPAGFTTDILITSTLPRMLARSPFANFQIARIFYETDRLHEEPARLMNAMDRIWAPSRHVRETFVRSGIDPSKIAIIPEAMDVESFAAEVEPWPLPGDEEFKILSILDWSIHKGWDVLLQSFAEAFGDDPKVGLYLKTWSSNRRSHETILDQADSLLKARVGKGLADFPNIHIWQETLPQSDMPRLYRAVDLFVSSSRAEGWCRPLMEAMAAGLPTIATGWGGQTDYHSEAVGFVLPYELNPVSDKGAREIPIFAGSNWVDPDTAELARIMKRIVADPAAARARGAAAQAHIASRYSREVVARAIIAELEICRKLASDPARPAATRRMHEAAPPQARRAAPLKPDPGPVHKDPPPPVDFKAALKRRLRLVMEGDFFITSSLAIVNAELALEMIAAGDIELCIDDSRMAPASPNLLADPRLAPLVARRGAKLSGPPDITIRHSWPPNWERPAQGKLVVMQPWERSNVPEEWLEPLKNADEIWAYSRAVRASYVRSGVLAEKVRIVPLGVDLDVFKPDGPRANLPTTRPAIDGKLPAPFSDDLPMTYFVIVGGAIDRKGADLQLDGFRHAFGPTDRVCLVVKDMGVHTFYRMHSMAEMFKQVANDPREPWVHYSDTEMTREELAALMRAGTVICLISRGEGFGLTPLEGMACGKAAILTAGSAMDDYASDDTAFRVAAYRCVERGKVDPADPVPEQSYELEADRDMLVEVMRWVHAHPDEVAQMGARAHKQAINGWSWKFAAGIARERILDIITVHKRPVLVQPRFWGALPTARRYKKGEPRPQCTVCIITRDEEGRIAECIRSLRLVADEIIVVDTGSKDRTREIARECGAIVYEAPWPMSFSAARNYSLQLANGRWLLVVDSDDVIDEENSMKLRDLMNANPRCDKAFVVQIQVPPGPNDTGAAVVDHVKLFPNRSDLRYEFRIHEQILPSIKRAKIEVLQSGAFVTHLNYDRSPEGQSKKRLRDFPLLYLQLRDNPKESFNHFNLGMSHLLASHEYEVAAHFLRRSIKYSDPKDSIVRKSYAFLTDSYVGMLDFKRAMLANEEGRAIYPDDPELLLQAGRYYPRIGRLDDARRSLERLCSGTDKEYFKSVSEGLRTYRGRTELALFYARMGDFARAIQDLEAVVAEFPAFAPAREALDELRTSRPVRTVVPAAAAPQEVSASAPQENMPDLPKIGVKVKILKAKPQQP